MLGDLNGDVGFGAMAARFAPHNEPDLRGERLARVIGSDSPLPRRVAQLRSMPLPDLTEDEHAELVGLVRQAIEADHFFLAPRAKRLRSILSKLNPAAIERIAAPRPPPRPAGTPSLVYQRLRGGHRRR